MSQRSPKMSLYLRPLSWLPGEHKVWSVASSVCRSWCRTSSPFLSEWNSRTPLSHQEPHGAAASAQCLQSHRFQWCATWVKLQNNTVFSPESAGTEQSLYVKTATDPQSQLISCRREEEQQIWDPWEQGGNMKVKVFSQFRLHFMSTEQKEKNWRLRHGEC